MRRLDLIGSGAQDHGRRIPAVFDSVRAVAATPVVEAARKIGLEIRAGCHTGEVVLAQNDAHGVAVHAAARVMALAGAGQVFVSWTTRDLLAGSGVEVDSVGRHALKGFDGDREVFRVVR
jgi:class 3 adenylate cyclase